MEIVFGQWSTIETSELFWTLTELPVTAQLMLHYPCPAYEPDHVEAFCRAICFACDFDTEYVVWNELAEAMILWAMRRQYDHVPERV